MLMARRVFMVLMGVLALGVLGAPAAFAEEGCPNEAVRQLESAAHPEGFATTLPDCRAYEQVTPVDKDGSGPTDFASGVQAAPAGDGLVFPVLGDMPGGTGGYVPSFFLARRGGQGWSDEGLEAPSDPYGHSLVVGWSEDLAETAVTAFELSTGSGGGVYLRNDAVGSFQLAFQYSPEFVEFHPAGFSADDSRMLFETEVQLSPSAAAGQENLYEWHAGVVSLVGVLPGPGGSAPTGGSFAGPNGGATGEAYTQHTISSDGSRVFFTAGGTEQIYVRENGTSTVPVGVGAFLAATPDGSKVIYLSGGVGGHLEMFDVESEQTTDLTLGGGVEGALGMSDDGSYVYFAANGGGIYVWHDGSIQFITANGQSLNWTPFPLNNGKEPKTSRVTPDGRFLLFAGADVLDRYDAVHGRLACVSCSPSGAPPAGAPKLQSQPTSIALTEPSILPRNLSVDGGRVFFESPEALLPQDTNGMQDVYEWEQQGVGSCQGSSATFSAASGGCLYLVSSGTSSSNSYFAEASASGDDAFFFTFQPLVGQDQDGLFDIYDARVGGGFAAQNPPAPPPPCEGEACRTAAGAAPAFGEPTSVTFTGAGNLTLPVPAPAVAVAPKPKPKHTVAKSKRKKKRRVKKAVRAGHGARAHRATRGGK
jgi:hypothetical protein